MEDRLTHFLEQNRSTNLPVGSSVCFHQEPTVQANATVSAITKQVYRQLNLASASALQRSTWHHVSLLWLERRFKDTFDALIPFGPAIVLADQETMQSPIPFALTLIWSAVNAA